MAFVKLKVNFKEHKWNVKMTKDTTVCQLQYKLRQLAKIQPAEALFLFFEYDGLLGMKEVTHAQSKLLTDIQYEHKQDILIVNVLQENAFGAWSKMFVKARIEQRKSLFCAVVTWSYYGLYHYDEVSIHNNINEATEHLLKIRCNGCLSLESDEKIST